MHHWSENANLKRKTVLGTGFVVKKVTKTEKVIPMYDHYAVGFNNCDGFNKILKEKNRPFKLRGDM